MVFRPCSKCGKLCVDGVCARHPRRDLDKSKHAERNARPGTSTLRGAWWRKTRLTVLGRDGGSCRYCLVAKADSVDHVVPRSRGGTYHMSNLAAACTPCNSSKGDRTVREWIESGCAPATAVGMLSMEKSDIDG